jgi:hypothetical protein
MKKETNYEHYESINGYEYYEFVDINGKPVKRNKYAHPYSYDEFVMWANGYNKEKDHAVYSDRLFQWDSKKYNKCCKEVWNNEGQYFNNREPKDIERFLSLYFGQETKLTLILEGCNISNGYPYWVFFFENKAII